MGVRKTARFEKKALYRWRELEIAMGSSILGCSPATTQGRRSYRYLCGFTPEGGPGRALPLRWSTPVHQPNQSGLHLEEEDWIGLEFGRQSWPPKRFATSEPSKSCNKSCTVTLSVPEHLAKRLELQPIRPRIRRHRACSGYRHETG
jgi:hypothetical protein